MNIILKDWVADSKIISKRRLIKEICIPVTMLL